jgi:hypothetical protein
MASARQQLGHDDFAREWSAGRRMTTDETIMLALQLTPSGPSAPRVRRATGT